MKDIRKKDWLRERFSEDELEDMRYLSSLSPDEYDEEIRTRWLTENGDPYESENDEPLPTNNPKAGHIPHKDLKEREE